MFLTSCFEYILIGVVLSAGRPFRQPMYQNCKCSNLCDPQLNTVVSLAHSKPRLHVLLTDLTLKGPFVGTIAAALGIAVYLVATPSQAVSKLMQFTPISTSYKMTILALGVVYLLFAWVGENYVFQGLARSVGWAKLAISGKPKTRKQYKVIAEKMRT